MKPVRALLPLSWAYGAAVGARNALFDAGILATADAGVPVVSVGNMTAGGTGKTPLVEYVARVLLARGWKPGVVSRGYGRRGAGTVVVGDGRSLRAGAAEGGDEPVQTARAIPAAVVVVAERRADAARVAVRTCGADVIVMDDGFQHRSLRRDLDIVAVDAGLELAREPMLPAGLRREPLSSLRRADLVVVTRAADPAVRERARRMLRGAYDGPVAASVTRLAGYAGGDDADLLPPEALRGVPVALFSGIGVGRGFRDTVAGTGALIVAAREFPDHHPYSAADLRQVLASARAAGAARIVTTEKDACRIGGAAEEVRSLFGTMDAVHTVVEAAFVEGEEMLLGRLDALWGLRGA